MKSLLHPVHAEMFPLTNYDKNFPDTRNKEHFQVNKAKSSYYNKSAVPYIQRLLNDYVKNYNKYQGFCFRFCGGGGMVPPPYGGD